MASSRSRRANAGSKMASLLNSEEADDFYKDTYGGFDEVENDNEFAYHRYGSSDSFTQSWIPNLPIF